MSAFLDTDRRLLTITVDNEGDGRRVTVSAGRDDTVAQAIAKLYVQLGRPPSAEDRLRCAVRDEDVLFFAGMRLEDHLEHCPDLHWLFACPAGGAGL